MDIATGVKGYFPAMSDGVINSPGLLAAREAELDRELLLLPSTIAQCVEVQLIKRLRVTTPWMIPLVIK